MNKQEFAMEKLQKSGATNKGIASLITTSFEIEAMTGASVSVLTDNLNSMGKGFASSKGVHDGNGWNSDVHHDVSLPSYDYVNDSDVRVYGTETSSSPLDTLGYKALKDEVSSMLDDYKIASKQRVNHTVMGSMHVHNTVAYMDDFNSIELSVRHVYDNVARFMLKFMPVLKWVTMTDRRGARGVRGSRYGDQFSRDGLFSWWSNYSDNTTSDSAFYRVSGMGRDSAFRAYSREAVHYENRLCDCTFNGTHITTWLSINKAITLFAIDFARNGFQFPLKDSEVETSRYMMEQHSRGYKHVNREWIEALYKEMVSYLAKYLKVINSLEVIEVCDKLIKCPISQYINENNIADGWSLMDTIEKVFNTRNRASDEMLRDRFLHSIKSMACPMADTLNDYLDNMATFLDVEVKKVKSLYQMFKKENVEIEWLGYRLVYLGD